MTNFLTEQDLAQIYKGDYVPMSQEIMDELKIDTYVWLQRYAPNTSLSEYLAICLRVLGQNFPRSYKAKLKGNSEKTVSECPTMTDKELIEFYLRERRKAD